MTIQTKAAALGDTASRLSFNAQQEAITKEGEADMLNAARLQNELNRTNMFAKLMEAGPKAAKDLIS
ncbi:MULTISPECIES: serine kinase/phosphatase [Ralstonia]|uniref:Serine kinase/phosphatase n=1 Tax=Ralstonia mojiangensis TaxID=2953895 RepID=A0AAE3I6W2_9RALS|nr:MULTISPECIES: serine kinase/phosphatase [Ralstonia]MCO5414803.1 serine kinase/phosphatase [Ralstonia mojiangensis]MCT7312001.1 serine kinase/phosphatase [Ralstonia mojiangensis]MCT7318490.1 serine kinase/phosphatase [Ralstonia mojiangensis]MCT7327547.1 serine kinase/phosphatase [Ralstonia mojiangensis]TXD60742.1 serine kinase/phosphatase [Ralstonia sp. TCR112]